MDDLANLPKRMREISYLLEQGERIPPHEDEHLLEVGATEIERLRVEINRLWALYDELLLQVGNKHPDETRHQTALRYLRKAENTTELEAFRRAVRAHETLHASDEGKDE